MENNYTIAQDTDLIYPDQRTINQIQYPIDCIEENFNENNFDCENAFGDFDCAGL